MANAKRVLVTAEHENNVKHEPFTPKQAERLASLLEVASQSTDSSTDSALLDRLARVLTA